jgi:hypothetical protein
MVAQKFGSADRDVRSKGSKEKTDKPMLKASARTPYTGMIGGPANVSAFKNGGSVQQGGFRNAAMEHKR